jgi:hypothetical protein
VELASSLRKGTLAGLKVLWELAKVIIPATMAVNLMTRAGWLPYISRALGPAMSLFGVPGEGALVLVTANLSTVYAGLAVMAALELTWKQKTILAAMMMICHAAVSETALIAKAGARASWVLAARLTGMVLVGLALNWVLPGP